MYTQEIAAPAYAARGLNHERFDAIIKYAGSSILDVGCGSGAYVLALSDKYQIAGVDFQVFESWKAKPHLFSLSDASKLNWANSSVDTVLSFEALEHLPDPRQALREYYRVCKKNLILTVPNCEITPGMDKSRLIYYHWIDRTHVNFFKMQTICDLVEEVGFKIVTSYYINRISIMPFFEEAFDTSGLVGRLTRTILSKRQRREYRMTCLIVAGK